MQVIQYFESLESMVNGPHAVKSRVRRAPAIAPRAIAGAEAVAIAAVADCQVDDALEIMQLLAELEYAVDTSLFPKLAAALEAHIVQHVDAIDSDVGTWTQVCCIDRQSHLFFVSID